jgi:hypothetical protein
LTIDRTNRPSYWQSEDSMNKLNTVACGSLLGMTLALAPLGSALAYHHPHHHYYGYGLAGAVAAIVTAPFALAAAVVGAPYYAPYYAPYAPAYPAPAVGYVAPAQIYGGMDNSYYGMSRPYYYAPRAYYAPPAAALLRAAGRQLPATRPRLSLLSFDAAPALKSRAAPTRARVVFRPPARDSRCPIKGLPRPARHREKQWNRRINRNPFR